MSLTSDHFRGVWLRTLWKESDAPEPADSTSPFQAAEDGMFVIDRVNQMAKLTSYALWVQSPPIIQPEGEPIPQRPYFADVRCVPQVGGKFGQPRWFAGTLDVSEPSPTEQEEANRLVAIELQARGCNTVVGAIPACRLTWHRAIDSLPESCPTGLDSAMCFLVPPADWLEKNDIAKLSWDCLIANDGNNTVSDASGMRWTVVEAGDGYWEVWERIATWSDKNTACVTIGLDEKDELLKSFDFCFIENHHGLRPEVLTGPAKGHIEVSASAGSKVALNFMEGEFPAANHQ